MISLQVENPFIGSSRLVQKDLKPDRQRQIPRTWCYRRVLPMAL